MPIRMGHLAIILLLWIAPLPAQQPSQNSQDVAASASSDSPTALRTDLRISGVYPHLTTYAVYSQNGAHDKAGHSECGIGAIVPWGGKLWMVNYAPHMPRGSEHKLFSVSADLTQPMTIHPESVGGTPAGRMIHRESNQLLIAHYLIDAAGNVRTIAPAVMPIRVTAIARHLQDPENLVYYVDMEGSIWEANVHTLAVKRLFAKPVPGWHGKGGYTSQGRLVVSNNGELHVGSYKDLVVGGAATNDEERGVLAEFDGTEWRIVERRQFTEVTGPTGISGGSAGNDPLWAVGWDRRSVRLKLLDNGRWSTYLLPKASYCNDASHGWYTEWPRIREITGGRWLMDMHGMFFDFPPTFSAANSAGIRPIGSHLRYVPDFCEWNGQLVLATDETSIQDNPLAGQPQSNLWFGDYADLHTWGPASGYGGPWLEDAVSANTPCDPFLVAGFDHRLIHFAVGKRTLRPRAALRATDQQTIHVLPDVLAAMPRVGVPRGDWHQPAAGFEFQVDRPVTVFLAVDKRGDPVLPDDWILTTHTLTWGKDFEDGIYRRDFDIGTISIPGNPTEHTPGSYGMPHLAFVHSRGPGGMQLKAFGNAAVMESAAPDAVTGDPSPVTFRVQVDRDGRGQWEDLDRVTVPAEGYLPFILPEDLNVVWLRLMTDRDCTATAFLHQTSAAFHDGNAPENRALFAGLADVGEPHAVGGLLYPAKRNRSLQMLLPDDRSCEFTKATFEFRAVKSFEAELNTRLQVEPGFTVDAASVVVESKGRRFRLPKGPSAFDSPFSTGWPRSLREVESERLLANMHGTFYEVPLVTNGAPPDWSHVRPVASHAKQIVDYCSWNGLLALTGVRADAVSDGHVFRDEKQLAALWLGGVDDLWRLGKPVGDGGPWHQTIAQAGVPSDPYLMTGYDQKSVRLAHESDSPVNFTLQVDINGTGLWVDYHSFTVNVGEVIRHEFPAGFSACWIRAVARQDTIATVALEYR